MLGILKVPGREPITDWAALKERAWKLRTDEIMEVLRRDSERHRQQTPATDDRDA